MAASGATNANSAGAHRADTQTLAEPNQPTAWQLNWVEVAWPTGDSYTKKNAPDDGHTGRAASSFAEPADSELERGDERRARTTSKQ